MSDFGIKQEEFPAIVKKYHEVIGGNVKANPLDLTDEDLMGMLEASWR